MSVSLILATTSFNFEMSDSHYLCGRKLEKLDLDSKLLCLKSSADARGLGSASP